MPATTTSESHGNQSPNRTYGVTTSDDRIVCRRIAVRNRPASDHHAAAGIDERADARDGGVHHPPAVLHRAHPAHLQVLSGRRRGPVRRVVHRHHQERRPRRGRTPASSDGKLFSKQIGVPNGGSPSVGHGVHPLPRRPVDRDLLDRARSTTARRATARTRRTARGAPCRSGRPAPPLRSNRTTLVCCVPSGSSSTAPTSVGDAHRGDRAPPRRRPSRRRWPPPDRARPPPRRRGPADRRRAARGARCAGARRPRPRPTEESRAACRTSTCIVATSTSEPFGTENGISSGARIKDAASQQPADAPARSPAADRRLHQERVHRQHDERHAPHARDRRQAQDGAGRRPARPRATPS